MSWDAEPNSVTQCKYASLRNGVSLSILSTLAEMLAFSFIGLLARCPDAAWQRFANFRTMSSNLRAIAPNALLLVGLTLHRWLHALGHLILTLPFPIAAKAVTFQNP